MNIFSSIHPSRQVFEAYRNGKVEEAMSFGFLLLLFSGDLTNFAGCYLTRQLPIQVNARIKTQIAQLFHCFGLKPSISLQAFIKYPSSSSLRSLQGCSTSLQMSSSSPSFSTTRSRTVPEEVSLAVPALSLFPSHCMNYQGQGLAVQAAEQSVYV